MKFRYVILLALILFSAAIVAGVGSYLKYDVIRPLELTDYQDKSVFELPFVYIGDPVLQFMVENSYLLMQPEEPLPSDEPSIPDDPSEPFIPGITIPSTGGDQEPSVPQPPPSSEIPSDTLPPAIDPNLTPLDPGFRYPSDSVPDSWFDNTLFIGDSRTVGLRDYARFPGASYFCDVGMNVFNYSGKTLSDKTFGRTTLESLLRSKKFDKVFINLGLNECGYAYAAVTRKYKELVDMVRQLQPEAIIILQSIMSVTPKKAAQASYFQPSNLQKISRYYASLADGRKIFYIDVNEYFTDKDGYLLSGITNDGYHPTATGYAKWKEWIAYAAGTLGV